MFYRTNSRHRVPEKSSVCVSLLTFPSRNETHIYILPFALYSSRWPALFHLFSSPLNQRADVSGMLAVLSRSRDEANGSPAFPPSSILLCRITRKHEPPGPLEEDTPFFLLFVFLLSQRRIPSIDHNLNAIQQDARSILNFVCDRRRLLRRSHGCIAIIKSYVFSDFTKNRMKKERYKEKFNLVNFFLYV